ncbi:Mu-like prophage major head subunit gpT family protein [Micromonospora sp. NPDC049366]|uniref:phage major capsid protein n=1 Tax=Micromonospora sp. NPDC049366 TaxID=3364271 RepID=UPI00378ACD81
MTITAQRPTSSHFAATVEAIDARGNDIRAMFGGGGMTAVSRSTREAGVAQYGRPQWETMVLEAERFVDEIIRGRRGLHQFAEAMSTDLFPALFGDSLDRQLYGAYTAAPTTWRNYCRRALVNDFREVKRFATSGIRGLLKETPELSEHERRTQDEREYKYAVKKYEAGFGLSFEAMVNDDLDAFARLPQDLAQSAVDSEEYFATSLWAGPSGLNTSFFTVGNDNILTGNPALTRTSLQAAITKLMKRTDERGNPIAVTAVELVVGPGLALQAQEIIDATEYRVIGPGGNITIISGNGVAANLRRSVNFWLPTVASTANADTTWAVFANPDTSGRPAIEVGFLRGYEQPGLYEKIPDMRRIGGGEVPWSFNHSQQEKKVQHVFGGTFVDPRMVVGSDGKGS